MWNCLWIYVRERERERKFQLFKTINLFKSTKYFLFSRSLIREKCFVFMRGNKFAVLLAWLLTFMNAWLALFKLCTREKSFFSIALTGLLLTKNTCFDRVPFNVIHLGTVPTMVNPLWEYRATGIRLVEIVFGISKYAKQVYVLYRRSMISRGGKRVP